MGWTQDPHRSPRFGDSVVGLQDLVSLGNHAAGEWDLPRSDSVVGDRPTGHLPDYSSARNCGREGACSPASRVLGSLHSGNRRCVAGPVVPFHRNGTQTVQDEASATGSSQQKNPA